MITAERTVEKASLDFSDLMKDFTTLNSSKSNRLPHGFVQELEKRIQQVLIGKDTSSPAYNDLTVKRTFAIFLNTLSEPSTKKRMQADRRAEDLILLFYSGATKELSKGKSGSANESKQMVNQHTGIFLRLLRAILVEKDWARDKPQLAARLVNLMGRLLSVDRQARESPSRYPDQDG